MDRPTLRLAYQVAFVVLLLLLWWNPWHIG